MSLAGPAGRRRPARAQVGGGPGGAAVVVHAVLPEDGRNAEVGQFGPGPAVVAAVVDQQDVRRLDVPVDDPVVVDVRQPVRQVIADVGHVRGGKRALEGPLAQVVTGHEFHHQVGQSGVRIAQVGAGVEQGDQGVVAHPCENPDFLPLPACALEIVRVVAEELDRHLALQQLIVRAVDGRLASPANEGFDPVPSAQQKAGFHSYCQRGSCSLDTGPHGESGGSVLKPASRPAPALLARLLMIPRKADSGRPCSGLFRAPRRAARRCSGPRSGGYFAGLCVPIGRSVRSGWFFSIRRRAQTSLNSARYSPSERSSTSAPGTLASAGMASAVVIRARE